jgi:hypothetical protein
MRNEHPNEPEAARLRREGRLWPENLTNEDLTAEIDQALRLTANEPVSWGMLQAEIRRRKSKA